MDQEGLDWLVPAFIKNKSLVKLDLSMNDIEDSCASSLIKIMSGQSERLDEIVWSYGLWGELPENIHKEGLREFNLSKNKLGPQLATMLETSLKHNVYIRVLDLSGNLMNEDDTALLAQGIDQN